MNRMTRQKTKRRRKVEPARRNSPAAACQTGASVASLKKKIAALSRRLNDALEQQTATSRELSQALEQQATTSRELSEALEQQAATSGVLRIISSSPMDIQSVLHVIGENAARLCDANNAVILGIEGDLLRHVASYGQIPTSSRPREAVDGEAGVAAAAAQRPDLILMDIQLPLLDGYEATRRIKADPALRAIPIIVITSYALSGDDEKARAAGCDAYFSKPFSPRQLLAKVREYLSPPAPTS